MLRQVLVETDQWGAVRVLPATDHAAELLISGEIVRSDGEALELRVRAVDAGGLEWDATLDIEITDWKVVRGTKYFAGNGQATLRHKTGEVVWSCKFNDYGFKVPSSAGQIDDAAAARAIAELVVNSMPKRPALPRE